MGQKVHPTGARLGITTDWSSKWYANSKDFSEYIKPIVKTLFKKEIYIIY